MRIRAAQTEDAAALGRVMVEAWLAAHRGQVPDAAWHERAATWTPDVSAHGWSTVLTDRAAVDTPDDVLLLAEDDQGEVVGLVYGVVSAAEAAQPTAEIVALYVAPARHREGVGAALLTAGARQLADLGATGLRLTVLEANHPARRFYKATGGLEAGRTTVDEEGHVLPAIVVEWSDVPAAFRA